MRRSYIPSFVFCAYFSKTMSLIRGLRTVLPRVRMASTAATASHGHGAHAADHGHGAAAGSHGEHHDEHHEEYSEDGPRPFNWTVSCLSLLVFLYLLVCFSTREEAAGRWKIGSGLSTSDTAERLFWQRLGYITSRTRASARGHVKRHGSACGGRNTARTLLPRNNKL